MNKEIHKKISEWWILWIRVKWQCMGRRLTQRTSACHCSLSPVQTFSMIPWFLTENSLPTEGISLECGGWFPFPPYHHQLIELHVLIAQKIVTQYFLLPLISHHIFNLRWLVLCDKGNTKFYGNINKDNMRNPKGIKVGLWRQGIDLGAGQMSRLSTGKMIHELWTKEVVNKGFEERETSIFCISY